MQTSLELWKMRHPPPMDLYMDGQLTSVEPWDLERLAKVGGGQAWFPWSRPGVVMRVSLPPTGLNRGACHGASRNQQVHLHTLLLASTTAIGLSDVPSYDVVGRHSPPSTA